ncbi:hypothetical protein CBR_g40468 [Chara braunii]|uniref:Uncharacterized protein n=1 Tax=Chara braunii TaxID=69332 RepID=A0A388LTU8_CHABU|nr:hypothetical protein CBR_g40468 [Chara braunii]|eukprot:GBG85740.1 hypothetical protein CBR_g40468 [Chara braunii]
MEVAGPAEAFGGGNVKRTTDDIGKKWDNLFQQYKNVQRYQNASRGNNFFNLTPALRTKEGFNFRMDERMYLDNLADTSARGEVQMSGDTRRPSSVAVESIAGGDAGDGNDEDGGSARESGFSACNTGGAGKRKNMRQQTFDVIAEVMEKHGALMADTVEGERKRQCNILEREVDAQKRHYEAFDEAKRMMCSELMEIAKAIRDRSSSCALSLYTCAILTGASVGGIVRGRFTIYSSAIAHGTWQTHFAFSCGTGEIDHQRIAPCGQSQLKRRDNGSGEGGGGQNGRGHVLKSKRPRGDGSEDAMGGQGGQDVSVMEIPSTGTPTLRFGRDGVSREHFQAVAALGVPGIGHGGGSGSVRSQGIVISESAPQTPVTSTAMIVSAVEHADKGPVHVPQARHVEPSNMNTVGRSSREVVSLSHAGSGDVNGLSTATGERREEQGPSEAGRKDERRDGTPRPDDEDDEFIRMRKKKTRQEEELEAKSKLWRDGKTLWGKVDLVA